MIEEQQERQRVSASVFPTVVINTMSYATERVFEKAFGVNQTRLIGYPVDVHHSEVI